MSSKISRIAGNINWLLVLSTAMLIAIGMLNVYSSGSYKTSGGIVVQPYYTQQIQWCILGIIAMVCMTLVSYHNVKFVYIIVYLAVIVLLVLVLKYGLVINKAQRWLRFAGITVQPSELAKLGMIIVTAMYLSTRKEALGWLEIFTLLIISAPILALVHKQPDLGTTLNILLIVGSLALFHGIRRTPLFIALFGCVASALPLWFFFMKPYQKLRILMLFNPELDPDGAGYNTIQAKITVGSGGLTGKGFLQGDQNLLSYLPEKHTDFAIAVFSEEWGFLGNVCLMLLFCVFLFSIVSTIQTAKDRLGAYLCAGVFFYFFWQIFINIGMVIGIMPVVGIPLPFISYGGTSMLVSLIAIGIVQNVSIRRFMFKGFS